MKPVETLKPREFKTISDFIFTHIGISLSEEKIPMVEGRLQKRLKSLSISNYSEYLKLVFTGENQNEEQTFLLNLLTTNKTDFFREYHHFDFIKNVGIKEIIKSKHLKPHIRAWSAACSTGEEPYSIAILLKELQEKNNNFEFDIHASDVSTEVIDISRKGVYDFDRIAEIPFPLKSKYFLKGKDVYYNKVRVVKEIREKVNFFTLNLIDSNYNLPHKFDFVFCRNVLIYFNPSTQRSVLAKIVDNIEKGGYLFLGHTECIKGFSDKMERAAPTVYRKVK